MLRDSRRRKDCLKLLAVLLSFAPLESLQISHSLSIATGITRLVLLTLFAAGESHSVVLCAPLGLLVLLELTVC